MIRPAQASDIRAIVALLKASLGEALVKKNSSNLAV